MKLASFTHLGQASYGVAEDSRLIDVGAVLRDQYPDLQSALNDLDAIRSAVAKASAVDEADVSFLPPIPDAGRIICIGLNYKAHIAETGRDAPKFPILFSRYPDSLVGSGEDLVAPKVSETFDFEGELAFVVGKPGRHISAEDALQHIAGYACFNDGSIRSYQRHTSQFLPGKTFWHSGSFGPYLVTRDEVPDVGDLHLQTRLNGTVMQDTKVNDRLFGVEDLIVYLSAILPLQPGDVVATGTTGGVGAFRDPKVWMKAGDVIEVEIAGLGTLKNRVVDE
jgi:2-keto-4-pentenoate hydratase/2-oxohepta-3-ene-1,7-dioic acid hydratase in catechol pathway